MATVHGMESVSLEPLVSFSKAVSSSFRALSAQTWRSRPEPLSNGQSGLSDSSPVRRYAIRRSASNMSKSRLGARPAANPVTVARKKRRLATRAREQLRLRPLGRKRAARQLSNVPLLDRGNRIARVDAAPWHNLPRGRVAARWRRRGSDPCSAPRARLHVRMRQRSEA